VFVLIVVPVVVYAGINFGHVDAVEEQVEDLDEQIKNNNAGTGSGPGQCSVNYGPWLSSINSMSDLDNELLETGLETGAKVNAIGNTRFSESDPDGTELTTDTMVQRCNTTFGDTGDPNYEHRIFCRGFRLPDGKQYDNFSDLKRLKIRGPPTSSPSLFSTPGTSTTPARTGSFRSWTSIKTNVTAGPRSSY